MAMQMGFRWYGEGNDKISLSDIRQIPGVSTIVWALHDKMPGEIWQPEEIEAVVSQIKAAGFNADVVESVNVHDDFDLLGLPDLAGHLVVQRPDNGGNTGDLPDVAQFDLVVSFAVPAKTHLHRHVRSLLIFCDSIVAFAMWE